MKKALKTSLFLLLLVSSFIACDKEFSDIGVDSIGDNFDHFETSSFKYPIVTFNKKVDPVQSDNLPINWLGVYNDPVYGMSKANFVSQMSSSTINPNFGENVVLDSVVFSMPYFSTVAGTTESGDPIYELDSVFGNSQMSLTLHRNNYFLRDFDPDSNFEDPQVYYSNGATSQTGMINVAELEGDVLLDLPIFFPSDSEIILTETDSEGIVTQSERLTPRLREYLDVDYWQELIIDKQGEPELSNQANFEDYFRGIYFKVEPINGMGTLSLIDFNSGPNITLFYTKDGLSNDDEGNPIREQNTYTLNFSGNRVNIVENTYNFPLVDGDDTTGDAQLFLKGGEGSVAVLDLFNGLVEDENGNQVTAWQHFEDNFGTDPDNPKRLINEANLILYVDQSMVQGEEPDRLYLYDLNNNQPAIDYRIDPLFDGVDPINSKLNHLGALVRVDDEPDGEGISYKIRLTEHMNNILLRDSTNVKLGVSVSGNVNLEVTSDGTAVPQNEILTSESNILNQLPISALVTPRGTVLHGNTTAQEEKRVYLEIFYTEPDNN